VTSDTITVALISGGGSVLIAITALILSHRLFGSLERRLGSLERRLELIEGDLKTFRRTLGSC
jgi:hypothetical protein